MATGNDVLDMLNATPEERAALARIAEMRAAGFSDAEIFGGLVDPRFTQGGGYGYIQPVLDAASIASSYNLGRGNLALSAQDAYYQRQANPFQIVPALQQLRDTGAAAALTDPTLASVQPSPASVYDAYLRSLYGGAAAAGGSATPAAAPGGSAVKAPGAAVNDVGRSWIEAWRAYHPGEPDPVPGYAETGANTGAQQAAARLVGGSLRGVGMGEGAAAFKSALAGGKVPGFSSLSERDFGLLSPDQQAAYFGLVGSTGRVSDPQAAYRDYLAKYAQR